MSAAMLTRPISHKILTQFPEPRSVFKYFLMCMETPRVSHKLDQIRNKILTVGKTIGCDCAVDTVGNVRLRKPASAGYENAVKVAMQCHIDMVCSKKADKVHNFETDPIEPIIEGDWLRADGTTLGADNGIGVAAALAILEDKSLIHGPLEAVFTVDEETTMGGAEFMDKAPFLQSSVLLNIDTEVDGQVCVGCAGGFEKHIFVPLQPDIVKCEEQIVYEVAVFGLVGGHTGTDIDKGRANALQILARVLSHAIHRSIPLRFVSLSGGNAPNAIPRDAKATVLVPADKNGVFEAACHEYLQHLREEYAVAEQKPQEDGKKAEPQPIGLTVQATNKGQFDGSHVVFTTDSTTKMVDSMLNVLHGPLRMIPGMANEVDTSISFSLSELPVKNNETYEGLLHVFCRSSSDYQMEQVERKLDSFARLSNARSSKRFNYFPGWTPNLNSIALKETVAAHKELFGHDPHVYSVHAGLECGLLMGHYPKLHCVSFGPTILDAHSPDERARIPSVPTFYKWLTCTLEKLAQVPESSLHQ